MDRSEPAFPLFTPKWHEKLSESGMPEVCDFTMGLSIRDYFAAKAMCAVLQKKRAKMDPNTKGPRFDRVAKLAYLMADEMLLERDK